MRLEYKMRSTITILLISKILLANELDIKDISSQLNSLSKQFEKSTLPKIDYDPFHTDKKSTHNKKIKKEQTKKASKKKKESLVSIFVGSAMIGSKWYRVGDNYKGYTIAKIDKTEVYLQRKGIIKILKFKKPKQVLIIKEQKR